MFYPLSLPTENGNIVVVDSNTSEDWYGVRKNDIIQNGGKYLLRIHNHSIQQLVTTFSNNTMSDDNNNTNGGDGDDRSNTLKETLQQTTYKPQHHHHLQQHQQHYFQQPPPLQPQSQQQRTVHFAWIPEKFIEKSKKRWHGIESHLQATKWLFYKLGYQSMEVCCVVESLLCLCCVYVVSVMCLCCVCNVCICGVCDV